MMAALIQTAASYTTRWDTTRARRVNHPRRPQVIGDGLHV